MKFKKTGAALLVATMVIGGTSYAWADEYLNDSSEELQVPTTEVTTETSNGASIIDASTILEDATETEDSSETTEATDVNDAIEVIDASEVLESNETTESIENTLDSTDIEFPTIPEGYTAGNLIALQKAFNNAGNDTAKAAIVRNAERAIAKFEAKQAQNNGKTTEVESEVVTEESTSTEQQTTEAPTGKAEKTVQKEERKALQAEHKAERKALKEEHKAQKQQNKEDKK